MESFFDLEPAWLESERTSPGMQGQFIPLAITWLVDVAHECMLAVEEKGSRRASLSICFQ